MLQDETDKTSAGLFEQPSNVERMREHRQVTVGVSRPLLRRFRADTVLLPDLSS
jgi:hypothetical protein